MTPDELKDLAARIASEIRRDVWVAGPVRPEPPGPPTPGQLPPWAGAAQSLSDVAPVPGRRTRPGRHRPAYEAVTVAWRGAAAGRGPSPLPGGRATAATDAVVSGRTVPIGISNRHIHVTQEHFEQLFGTGKLPTADRPITQPGQFAAQERLRVTGPAGSIDGVRIVGPVRGHTQVELAASDARALGLDAPVRHSGQTAGSTPVRLEGSAGSVDLSEGAIIAARHMHVSPSDAARLGLTDGDRVTLEVGGADRRATIPDVLVRSGSTHATEVHFDTDEARAYAVSTGDVATIVGRPARSSRQGLRKAGRLVTERDVSAVAARGLTLSDGGDYLVTPAARDRAKALGIWRESR